MLPESSLQAWESFLTFPFAVFYSFSEHLFPENIYKYVILLQLFLYIKYWKVPLEMLFLHL